MASVLGYNVCLEWMFQRSERLVDRQEEGKEKKRLEGRKMLEGRKRLEGRDLLIVSRKEEIMLLEGTRKVVLMLVQKGKMKHLKGSLVKLLLVQ